MSKGIQNYKAYWQIILQKGCSSLFSNKYMTVLFLVLLSTPKDINLKNHYHLIGEKHGSPFYWETDFPLKIKLQNLLKYFLLFKTANFSENSQ